MKWRYGKEFKETMAISSKIGTFVLSLNYYFIWNVRRRRMKHLTSARVNGNKIRHNKKIYLHSHKFWEKILFALRLRFCLKCRRKYAWIWNGIKMNGESVVVKMFEIFQVYWMEKRFLVKFSKVIIPLFFK